MSNTSNHSERPTLTDVLGHKGQPLFADGGAVNTTDGRRPIKECSACLGKVCFVQSKAGKWYLANVYQYGGDSPVAKFFYMKNSPHYKTCDQRRQENERIRESISEEAISRDNARQIIEEIMRSRS